MSSRIDGIKSRNDFAAETNSLSGLVRPDGQRPGTSIEMADTRQTHLPARLMDFVSLTKPEVLFLVLIATAAGCLMASDTLDPSTLFDAVLGTALVAAGTAALNHYAERAYDGKMRRTANRPLPSGRLTPQAALRFGIVLSVTGTIYLAVTCNLLTGAIGLAALLSYLLLYTPLKRRSDLCTLVGAFPGAAPILMGWTAVRDEITLGGWILYAILFFWQFPHFLAIGWMFRDDYARASVHVRAGRSRRRHHVSPGLDNVGRVDSDELVSSSARDDGKRLSIGGSSTGDRTRYSSSSRSITPDKCFGATATSRDGSLSACTFRGDGAG